MYYLLIRERSTIASLLNVLLIVNISTIREGFCVYIRLIVGDASLKIVSILITKESVVFTLLFT